MKISNDLKLDFKDVLIRPKRSEMGSRKDVSLTRRYIGKYSKRAIDGIPIIASNMDNIGTPTVSAILYEHYMFTCLSKYNNLKEPPNELTFATSGILPEEIETLFKKNFTKICIDVANGYTKFFVEKVKEIRGLFPHATIMAGNVATPEMVQEIILTGLADIVKIGIGPGYVCETRSVTGVGYPQLSAIMECADAAHGLGGLICADGGCRSPGDIAKAFGAGADFVMVGSLLSGHNETGNRLYGSASREAMDLHYGGIAEHRASEGRSIEVEPKGPLRGTIQQILGGLRSACTYIGAKSLKDFSKCCTFVRVT